SIRDRRSRQSSVRCSRPPDGLRSDGLRDRRQRRRSDTRRRSSRRARRRSAERGPWEGRGTTTGAGTIRSDGTLTSPGIAEFVARVRSSADVVINAAGAQSIGNVGSACATDGASSACWGTTDSPKIVYVGGAPSPGSPRPTLGVSGESSGAGILVVENATVEIDGNFRWNGLVVVAGPDA